MKKTLFTLALLAALTLCGCEKEGIQEQKIPWSVNDPWEPSNEAVTRSQPMTISLKEFMKKVKDVYYVQRRYYVCSDSLGGVCFWGMEGDPCFDKYDDNVRLLSSFVSANQSELLKFEKDHGHMYLHRIPYRTDYHPSRFAYKTYWCYDQKDGTFCMSYHPIEIESVRGQRTLIELSDTYMIVRSQMPDNYNPVGRNTYAIRVYQAIKDEDYAAQEWFLDADDADFERHEW